jgi:phosphate transport system ATP-binding protein
MNRMNDLIDGTRSEGDMKIDGVDVYSKDVDVVTLRRRVGMVFQKSIPFPKSIYENITYGLTLNEKVAKADLDQVVESSLRKSALWDEVKDRLHHSAQGLSGGQQQRLCIARAVAINPEILLMDEPCSALDPISTGKVEELITELKDTYTIVLVTHNMQQAGRVSDYTGFFLMGSLIEFDRTRTLFTSPAKRETEDYITGRFG